MLLVVPWSRFWDRNYFAESMPFVQAIVTNAFVRGAVSGLGLLNLLFGLVLVYATTAIPFCVWTLKGYFDSLPKELEEAARLDGASAFMIFWKVMLPLAKPGLAVTGLFCFMTAWNEFILAATFLGQSFGIRAAILARVHVAERSVELRVVRLLVDHALEHGLHSGETPLLGPPPGPGGLSRNVNDSVLCTGSYSIQRRDGEDP